MGLQVKELAKEKRKEMDGAERSEKSKADEIFKQKQREKAEARRQKSLQLATDYVKTVNEIAAKERKAKELELAFENQQMEQLKLEEDEFQSYAEQVIQQAQKADRNVFPLKAVAAKGAGGGRGPLNVKTGIRPSYLASDVIGSQMPTYKNEQTAEIRQNLEPGPARVGKRRLGFTW